MHTGIRYLDLFWKSEKASDALLSFGKLTAKYRIGRV